MTKTKEEIFELLKSHLLEIVPEINPDQVQPVISMKDLGANSIDRVDVILLTMEELELKFPLNELGGLTNMQALVDDLHGRL
uniref:Acyl carrier protein n=1 Tax=uncultured bacterial symbiont of Discodermia dissoluta TaxID=323654 RepID=Q49HJ8_9BACT|nr:acyl carrier protein [uncultured bacterial symbiont of Discodermia dissoluta]